MHKVNKSKPKSANTGNFIKWMERLINRQIDKRLNKLGIPRLMAYGTIKSITIAGTNASLSYADVYINGATTAVTNIPVNPDIAPSLQVGDPVWVMSINFDNRDMYVINRHNGLPLYANPSDPTKISFDNLYGNTLTLGGSGNGNGTARILDSTGAETILLNNEGIQLENGAKLIGGSGVLTELLFQSSGDNQGWQDCGWYNYSSAVNTMALLFVYIPPNFTITSATLYTKHIAYYENDAGGTKWWYLTNGQLMYAQDASGTYYNGAVDSYVQVNNMTDITAATWGSYWNPTSDNVSIKSCDVSAYLAPGQRRAFGVNSHDATYTSGQISGMAQFELVVTGYKSS